MEKITDVQLQYFLSDFEQNSETIILEEGKERQELEQIAKARGIKLKDSKDLAGFKTIYTFANKANENNVRLPKQALLKALPTLVGKPVDIDHIRSYVVGHYIDYRYRAKEDMVVAYGVFYKSNFGEEWEEAKRLFKEKKLATSYEIWTPKDKRRKLADGTIELLEQEIAGGALLFKEKPAFKDARVLELAKANLAKQPEDLIFAKKYKENEIITNASIPSVQDDVVKPSVTLAPQPIKIKCSNCEHEWEISSQPEYKMGAEKCPKCFAILKQDGTMIHPPQIMDFKIGCPTCNISRWLILSRDETTAKLRCSGCAREYKIVLDTKKREKMADRIDFIYSGRTSCYQCQTPVSYSGVSQIKSGILQCKKCGLSFPFDITNEQYKKVSSIELIDKSSKSSEAIDKITQSSEQGGQTKMEKKKIEKAKVTNEFEGKTFDETKQLISARLKEAEKASKVKKEDSSGKVEDTPKTDEKPEVKQDTPKSEVTPKVKEAPKAEDIVSVDNQSKKAEAKVEDKASTESKPEKVEKKVEEKAKVEKKVEKKAEAIVEKPVEEKVEESTEILKAGIKKLATQVIALKEKVKLYEANAKEIIQRRADLGEEYCKDLSDTDILNDDKYALARAEKENAILTASMNTGAEKVGSKSKDDEWYTAKRKAITTEAFRHTTKKK